MKIFEIVLVIASSYSTIAHECLNISETKKEPYQGSSCYWQNWPCNSRGFSYGCYLGKCWRQCYKSPSQNTSDSSIFEATINAWCDLSDTLFNGSVAFCSDDEDCENFRNCPCANECRIQVEK